MCLLSHQNEVTDGCVLEGAGVRDGGTGRATGTVPDALEQLPGIILRTGQAQTAQPCMGQQGDRYRRAWAGYGVRVMMVPARPWEGTAGHIEEGVKRGCALGWDTHPVATTSLHGCTVSSVGRRAGVRGLRTNFAGGEPEEPQG